MVILPGKYEARVKNKKNSKDRQQYPSEDENTPRWLEQYTYF